MNWLLWRCSCFSWLMSRSSATPPSSPLPALREAKPPFRILVVEHDNSIRQLSYTTLTHQGYQVDAAEDGAAGWDALQAGICLQAKATLVTRNLSHYSRIPGLAVMAPEEA